jgi:hypothetical protein
MRRVPTVIAATLAAVVLLAAGCGNSAEFSAGGGGNGGNGGNGGPLSNGDEVFQSVRDGVQNLNGCSYTADLEMTGVADPAAASDPASQLGQNLKLHSEGSFSKDTMAAQMKVDVSVAGQSINAEIKANDSGVYVGMAGNWYQVPPDQTEQFKEFATMSPVDITAKLGINVDDLTSARTLAGTETIDGVECYHVVAKPDPKQVAKGIVDALASPDVKDKVASGASSLSVDPAEAEKLQDVIKSIDAEYWVEVETGFIRKGTVSVKMERAPGDTTSGLKSADLKISFSATDFNEPVTVETPASTLPWDQLGSALMGGGTGTTTP